MMQLMIFDIVFPHIVHALHAYFSYNYDIS